MLFLLFLRVSSVHKLITLYNANRPQRSDRDVQVRRTILHATVTCARKCRNRREPVNACPVSARDSAGSRALSRRSQRIPHDRLSPQRGARADTNAGPYTPAHPDRSCFRPGQTL
jgi:hypothetical protein